MNYICKNCGAFVSEEKYKNEVDLENSAFGCGCFIWLIILLCFVSVILIPIAIILILQLHKGCEKVSCPYCNSQGSLIPEDSPIAKKIIEENFTQEQKEEISKVHKKQNIIIQENNELEHKNNGIALGTLLVVIIIAILMAIFH